MQKHKIFAPEMYTAEFLYTDSLNKNIKMSSFKSRENIQKKEGGPDRSVSDNYSAVTLNELLSPYQDADFFLLIFRMSLHITPHTYAYFVFAHMLLM